jgi:hypothetical protein
MSTVETVTTLETCSGKVGLLVMDCILLDKIQETNHQFNINKQVEVVKAAMKEMDCVELNDALFFYEKATGKLGQSTYLR